MVGAIIQTDVKKDDLEESFVFKDKLIIIDYQHTCRTLRVKWDIRKVRVVCQTCKNWPSPPSLLSSTGSILARLVWPGTPGDPGSVLAHLLSCSRHRAAGLTTYTSVDFDNLLFLIYLCLFYTESMMGCNVRRVRFLNLLINLQPIFFASFSILPKCLIKWINKSIFSFLIQFYPPLLPPKGLFIIHYSSIHLLNHQFFCNI